MKTKTISERDILLIKDAIDSGNYFDLYDSVSDAGFETDEFHRYSKIDNFEEVIFKMRQFAVRVLVDVYESYPKLVTKALEKYNSKEFQFNYDDL